MKIEIKSIKKEILSADFVHKVGGFFNRNLKKFIFGLFFAASIYCGFVWYSFVYNPNWSTEKEAAYLKTKDKEVTFNRKKFQDIVEKEQKRAEEYIKTVSDVNDIFRIGQEKPKPEPQEIQPNQDEQSAAAL